MDFVLAALLILLGVSLWVLAGLLPILKLEREDSSTTIITPQLTWMGAFTLWQQRIIDVRGATLVTDPTEPERSRVELQTSAGRIPLTGPYARGLAPARMAQIIDCFAHDHKIPPGQLPLRGRMHLMIGFAIFFPLGTAAIFFAVLLLLR